MRHSMQRLTPADELLIHQIPETFATIAEADVSWTEKIWASLFAKDGSLQIDCGLGKYHNRNVMDMFAGVSRGVEQLTVRASRQLDLDPDRLGAGPFDYAIIEPLRKVRFVLRENDVMPLEFDVTLTAMLPPFLEAKDGQREPVGFRVCSQVMRYHQLCSVEGWVTIDGTTVPIRPGEWLGVRDHSWGLRMDVGEPYPDLPRYDRMRLERDFILTWSPLYLQRPDGTWYEIHHYLQAVDGQISYFSGFVNNPDGSQTPLHSVRQELKFDPANRRLLVGKLIFDAGWGKTRELEIEPVSDTGFHLGTGLYFGFKGMRHGNYLGREHIDGERYADVSDPQIAREVHQLRDCVVRVREADAAGYGIFESIVVGEHPEFGLTRENSFL